MDRRVAAAAVLAMAVVVGACGGGGGGGIAEALSIEAVDFAFDPDVWRVPTGTSIPVEVTNSGTAEHNWVVLGAGLDVTTAGDVTPSDILFEMNTKSGATATATFPTPAPGTYEVVCTIPGHLEAGMKGELRVVSG